MFYILLVYMLYSFADYRITESQIKEAIKHLDPTHFQCYICGPPALINFIAETLMSNGVDESTIHYEKWW